ncbi:hypothetical protein [Pedobacter miscanthi]|uniref:hypothetical protein n=1 Tax=Pedobacter miscanthi TaxID=2259170 RepID=UPI00292F5C3E|nr:hypothetical protein [Pedobacter miscanthi]
MKNSCTIILITILSITLYACGKKTDKDRAIELVESKYENSSQKPDFELAKLDSLYNISPMAYHDSLKKGNELDAELAKLESEIEHLSQAESDSVGLISAKLTKERYHLLEVAKAKPVFIGWKLTDVKIDGPKPVVKIFNFDKGITRIVE